ncbi:8-oxo-dGTP diphosphatase [Natronocella acetinitrilica]|uniref:8-oxo-dGTP diphosphatase n=1 Tax=Natronocella acetinitrilica TaxID=414046 RepID=A0AAE3G714_9GAMM|nr:8-oxo-dGTP diphosphatase [Natronocella acetinitrilica]
MAFSAHSQTVSTDVVLFTIRDDRLMVLLVRRPREPFGGYWALPGGLVHEQEDLDDCAARVLQAKAAVSGIYLEQLYSFGRPGRDPRGRVITVTYYALAPTNRLGETVMKDSDDRCWAPVDQLPALAFDHNEIVPLAHQRLAAKLEYSTIALQFMGERFTLSELQTVYEVILGESLDKRNFRRRLQGLRCIEETGEWFRGGSHRPARLYRVRQPGRVDIIK